MIRLILILYNYTRSFRS